MLNGSPGTIPGAPFKSPMVSLTRPNPLYRGLEGDAQRPVAGSCEQPPVTDPGPEARLIRFKRLNISARNCTFTRSVTGMFLKRSEERRVGKECRSGGSR